MATLTVTRSIAPGERRKVLGVNRTQPAGTGRDEPGENRVTFTWYSERMVPLFLT